MHCGREKRSAYQVTLLHLTVLPSMQLPVERSSLEYLARCANLIKSSAQWTGSSVGERHLCRKDIFAPASSAVILGLAPFHRKVTDMRKQYIRPPTAAI